ncbi:MAG: thioredoxin domain-containing protein [Candidatus Obscuribacterales bacterium]
MNSSSQRLKHGFFPLALAASLAVAGLPLIAAPLDDLENLKLTPALRPADDNSIPHVFKFNGYREPLASAGAQSKDPDAETKAGSKSSGAAESGEGLVWHDWDEALFERARKEKKFIVLDLEAVWCHWCHVMDHETYSRPAVREALNRNYICVKVDQDSRPDLSHRYEDYGWPATIIFDADGRELVKRSGYINPDKMLALLAAVVKNPSPQADEKPIAFAAEGVLPDSLKEELSKKHIEGFDSKNGAWGKFHKFLDWDSVDYSIELAIAGDKEAGGRARKTLDGQLNLLDPVWGGVYQYSTDGDWNHPHFEKIMQMQAENMRIYAIGYSVFGDEKYLEASRSIASYLEKFLTSPEGAFYTSQDADVVQGEHSGEYFELDDAGRRKAGVPRVDKHIYARENGWAIEGLAYLYMVTGEPSYLDRATRAAEWVKQNRAISSGSSGSSGGGFRHDESTGSGPYLGDSLAMGRAFLSLYEATADRRWLALAESAASFIAGHFADDTASGAGYLTAEGRSGKVVRPQPLLEENVRLARFANLLGQYTGDEKYEKMAKNAMRFLATPVIARRKKVLVAGILLADREIANAPTHITIVGSKKDQEARALFLAALMGPAVYRRLEWYDREEGKLPNMAVDYPELPQPAAFSCGDGKCSTPAFEPDSVRALFRVREI